MAEVKDLEELKQEEAAPAMEEIPADSAAPAVAGYPAENAAPVHPPGHFDPGPAGDRGSAAEGPGRTRRRREPGGHRCGAVWFHHLHRPGQRAGQGQEQ